MSHIDQGKTLQPVLRGDAFKRTIVQRELSTDRRQSLLTVARFARNLLLQVYELKACIMDSRGESVIVTSTPAGSRRGLCGSHHGYRDDK